jgi:DNA-binding NarL/FixJ family response regulator
MKGMLFTMHEKPSTNQANHGKPVLIAARPNRARDSLRVLLKLVPGINVIAYADDSASALNVVSECDLVLVLLDTNLPGEGFFTVLEQIRVNGSQSRCLVLVDNSRQRVQAQAAGADAALLKGFPTSELFEAIEMLLSE